jgi:dTDP-glucose 4,6-dehydratase
MMRVMHSTERRPVSLGNPVEHTVRRIVELVLKLSGGPSTLIPELLPTGDSKWRCPDISRAREVLSWEPRGLRHAGLKKTLGCWFARRRVYEVS